MADVQDKFPNAAKVQESGANIASGEHFQMVSRLYSCAICSGAFRPSKRNNVEQHVWQKHLLEHKGEPANEKYRAGKHKRMVAPFVIPVPEETASSKMIAPPSSLLSMSQKYEQSLQPHENVVYSAHMFTPPPSAGAGSPPQTASHCYPWLPGQHKALEYISPPVLGMKKPYAQSPRQRPVTSSLTTCSIRGQQSTNTPFASRQYMHRQVSQPTPSGRHISIDLSPRREEDCDHWPMAGKRYPCEEPCEEPKRIKGCYSPVPRIGFTIEPPSPVSCLDTAFQGLCTDINHLRARQEWYSAEMPKEMPKEGSVPFSTRQLSYSPKRFLPPHRDYKTNKNQSSPEVFTFSPLLSTPGDEEQIATQQSPARPPSTATNIIESRNNGRTELLSSASRIEEPSEWRYQRAPRSPPNTAANIKQTSSVDESATQAFDLLVEAAYQAQRSNSPSDHNETPSGRRSGVLSTGDQSDAGRTLQLPISSRSSVGMNDSGIVNSLLNTPRFTSSVSSIPPDRLERLNTLHRVLLDLERIGTISINRSKQSDPNEPKSTAVAPIPMKETTDTNICSTSQMWRPVDLT